MGTNKRSRPLRLLRHRRQRLGLGATLARAGRTRGQRVLADWLSRNVFAYQLEGRSVPLRKTESLLPQSRSPTTECRYSLGIRCERGGAYWAVVKPYFDGFMLDPRNRKPTAKYAASEKTQRQRVAAAEKRRKLARGTGFDMPKSQALRRIPRAYKRQYDRERGWIKAAAERHGSRPRHGGLESSKRERSIGNPQKRE